MKAPANPIFSILQSPQSRIIAMVPEAFDALMVSGFSRKSKAPESRQGASRGMHDSLVEISQDFGIAVVTVKGIITPYADDLWWECAVDPRGLANTLRQLAGRGDLKTIVLHIDSPGGHALGLIELAAAMAQVRERVQLVAYGDKLIASAAYWAAAGCDAIFAAPSAAIGSIGVYCPIYTFEKYLKNLGVKLHLFRDGDLKGLGLFGKELTPEESAHIDEGVQKISRQFKGYVRERRGAVADDTMRGQCHDGDECVALNLVDGNYHSLSELVSDLM